MKNMLYVAFILSFLLMSLNGIVFFIADSPIDNLIGLIVFAVISFLLVVISEKKFGKGRSFATILSRIVLGTLGGVIIAALLFILTSKVGSTTALFVFVGIIFASYFAKGFFSRKAR